MIEIVGIGPFVVSSLVIRAMGGPQALIAWLAGALLATLDAFVWSELGAAMPKAGTRSQIEKSRGSAGRASLRSPGLPPQWAIGRLPAPRDLRPRADAERASAGTRLVIEGGRQSGEPERSPFAAGLAPAHSPRATPNKNPAPKASRAQSSIGTMRLRTSVHETRPRCASTRGRVVLYEVPIREPSGTGSFCDGHHRRDGR